MARRYIGDAVVYIKYHDEGDYRGSIVVCKKGESPKVWKFRDLGAPAIGFGPGIAYDSPEAYDRMAQSAMSFGSQYIREDRRDGPDNTYPSREAASAIDEAKLAAFKEDGTYEVRRRR